MNSTKWPSLTEFAKFLGREGICRVEENDKGIHVAWIDNSPENLRRQDAIRKKERQDKGDEEREQMLIRQQVRKAQLDAEARGAGEMGEAEGKLERAEGEKIKLSFGAKSAAAKELHSNPAEESNVADMASSSATPTIDAAQKTKEADSAATEDEDPAEKVADSSAPAPGKVSLKMGFQSKPKNVFAAAKKNALGGRNTPAIEQPKKMSEAERIMKEEIERKNKRAPQGFGGAGPAQKKQRF